MKSPFFLLIIAILCGGCANIVSPDGGEPDKIPPKCIEILPADKSVNFSGGEIRLKFDENVQIRNKQAIEISPTITTPMQFVERSAQIIVRLPDSLLQKNTTYTINFGDNITDMNESTTLKNFSYVFSTGNFVDSLQILGNVQDAFLMQNLPNIVVGLYNAADTVINQKPMYFTKTDKDGKFMLQNLRNQAYQIVAFDDKAADTKPQTAEPIGFLDSLIDITKKPAPVLRLYIPPPPKPASPPAKSAKPDTTQPKPAELGTLMLTNGDTLMNKNMVAQLLNAQNEVAYTQKITANITTFVLLKPEMYRLRLYIDANKNDVLDGTNFMKKQQPETVFLFKDAIKIRANWEIEQDLKKIFEK